MQRDRRQLSTEQQQNKTQEKEISIEEKNKLNTFTLQKNISPQFSQQKVQNNNQFEKAQQAQKSSKVQTHDFKWNKNKSNNQYLLNAFCNTKSIISVQEPNEQIQTQFNKDQHQFLKYKQQQVNQNTQFQLQKSVSIQIVPQEIQDQKGIKKQKQSNIIQEQKRQEIQTFSFVQQYKKMKQKLSLAQQSLIQSAKRHREEMQKKQTESKQKDQEIIRQRNSIDTYQKQEKTLLTLQNQQYCSQKKRLLSQIQKAAENNEKLLKELVNNTEQISKNQSQLEDKNRQIGRLTDEVKHLKHLYNFKLKQQLEFSALTDQFKKTTQENCNKLINQLTKFKQRTSKDHDHINQKINTNYDIIQEKLKEQFDLFTQQLKYLQQTYKNTLQGQQQMIARVAKNNQQLNEKFYQVQKISSQMLKYCYTKIDLLKQQVSRLQLDTIKTEQKNKKERQEMFGTICQYAKRISKLEVQLQKNLLIQMEQDFKKQIGTNWLSNKYENLVSQYDNYKQEKQKNINHLQKELQNLKDQLCKSAVQAQNRQNEIIKSITQFYSLLQKNKTENDSYGDQNKLMLIHELKNLIQIIQKNNETNMMLKISELQQQTQKCQQFQSLFQNFKKQAQSQLQKVYDEKWQLQSSLKQIQQVKKSKIEIENQYAIKEEILNDIIFTIKSQKNYTLREVIKFFFEKDTEREFSQLVNILDSACIHYEKSQKYFFKLKEQLDQKNKNYAILEKERNEIWARNDEIEQEITKKEAILKLEYNRYMQMSTKNIVLEHDLQTKQIQIKILKSKIDQLVNSKKQQIQENPSKQQLYLEQNKKNNQFSIKSEKATQTLDDNIKNLMQSEFKRYEEVIKKCEEELNKYKSIIQRLKDDVEEKTIYAYQHKEKLKIAQEKLKQISIKTVSQKELKSFQQKLNRLQEQKNQRQNEVANLLNHLKIKSKDLEIANQTIKRYQQQLRFFKQKEKHPEIVSHAIITSAESMKSRENSKSPLKFQLRDSPQRSIILDCGQDNQRLFKESNILIMNEDENFIKNTIQKFLGKVLLSAQIKFRMQSSKPDFLNEAKNALAIINTSNLVWIFKKQGQVFGALSFNKEIKQQQSALLFNLTKQKVIYPANLKSSWVPVKSDSFYLYFGVQEAKYIWKSKMFSITDSKAIKYFEQNIPLVGNFVSKQKMEVQQFQIFLLNIQK